MKKDYNAMNMAELNLELKRLKDNFEDLEETVRFNFTYSSAHIGGEQVKKDEESLRRLKEEISIIEQLLSKK
jgi:hypothetical protein